MTTHHSTYLKQLEAESFLIISEVFEKFFDRARQLAIHSYGKHAHLAAEFAKKRTVSQQPN